MPERRRRGPAHFRERDVKAAVRAVRAAGEEVAGVEIDGDGRSPLPVGQSLAALISPHRLGCTDALSGVITAITFFHPNRCLYTVSWFSNGVLQEGVFDEARLSLA